MKRLIFLITVFILNIFPAKITIFYNNSMNGHIDGCTCKADPKSGFVTKAYYLEHLINTNNLLFDTGDFFDFYNQKIKAKYILQIFKKYKYTAITVGEQDFSSGNNIIIKNKNKLNIISYNLLIKMINKNFKLLPYITKKVNNINFFISANTHPSTFKYSTKKIKKNITIRNNIKDLIKLYKKYKQKNYITILLSHSGFENDKKFSKIQNNNIDIIIGGHSQSLIKGNIKFNKTLIVQAGNNGNYLGKLDIIVKNGKILSYNNSIISFSYTKSPKSKYILNLLKQYKNEKTKSMILK